METKPTHTGSLELFIAMIISGSIGVLIIKSGQQPANVVFFRCVFAFLCLAPYCLYRGYIKRGFFKMHTLLPIVIAGILMVVNWVLLFKAFPLTSISLATLVYHINPFIVMLLGTVFLGQLVTRNDLAWTGLAFAGLALTMNTNGSFSLPSRSESLGLLLVLCATSLYAGTVILTKLTKNTPPALIVMIQTFVGIFVLLPFADFSALPETSYQWGCIITLGVIHTFLLYCLIFSAYQKLNVSVIAILSFAYPISTVVFDYLFFDHLITYWQVIGATLILLSTIGMKMTWKILPTLSVISK